MEKKADKKLVSFRLPDDLIHALRARAQAEGISVTELVQRLLRQALKTSDDDRIATLEAEIRELRQAKPAPFGGMAPSTVYTLFPQAFPQGGISYESEHELKQKIALLVEERIEAALAKKLNPKQTAEPDQHQSDQDVRD